MRPSATRSFELSRKFFWPEGGRVLLPPDMPDPDLRHDFPFDPTYGYGLDQLRSVGAPPSPADFSSFWRDTYEQFRQGDLNLTSREIDCPHEDFQLFEVAFDSLGGVRIGAWLTRPRGPAPASGGWVVGHGYGGRSGPDYQLPGPAAPAIFPCARGFDLFVRTAAHFPSRYEVTDNRTLRTLLTRWVARQSA